MNLTRVTNGPNKEKIKTPIKQEKAGKGRKRPEKAGNAGKGRKRPEMPEKAGKGRKRPEKAGKGSHENYQMELFRFGI